MPGNEILLNLDNVENLLNSEVCGGMLALARRDAQNEHNWNLHPITQKVVASLYGRLGYMNAKHVMMVSMFLQRLNLSDEGLWQLASRHTLRLLHKYNGREMAHLLINFDRELTDEMGESIIVKKANDEFFERIVSILPLHIPHFNKFDLVSVLEILVKRNLGSERLFYHYIYMQLERKVLKFSPELYSRAIIALADKEFIEDPVFWKEYMLVYPTSRQFSHEEAKRVWDALIYLRLKCPTIDV